MNEVEDTLAEMAAEDPAFAEELADNEPIVEVAMMVVGVRKRLNLTQSQFAKNAGVTQQYIAQLESGEYNPSIKKLFGIMRKNGIKLRIEAVLELGQAPKVVRAPGFEAHLSGASFSD